MNSEKVTKRVLFIASFILIILISGIVLTLISGAFPVFEKYGFSFIYSDKWDPTEGKEQYGALTYIVGTVITSLLALILCIPFAFQPHCLLANIIKELWLQKL